MRETEGCWDLPLSQVTMRAGNGAEAFLEDLAKEGRYHQDVWTT